MRLTLNITGKVSQSGDYDRKAHSRDDEVKRKRQCSKQGHVHLAELLNTRTTGCVTSIGRYGV
jgi:hypothetical protein